MTTERELLLELISKNGNCVNLGRTIKARHQKLYRWILSNTKFLDTKEHLKFNERVYCIVNGIDHLKLNAFNKPAIFVNLFSGYSLKESLNKKLKKGENIRQIKQQARDNKPVVIKQTKLEEFLNRNHYRNKHLYQDNLIDGYDYVVCPVSGARMSMIKKSYINNVLEMTVEEYDLKYPNIKKICDKRKENIKDGVNQIDEETGLTKYEVGQQKARKKLRQIDPVTGLSGYDLKGIATRATHMSKIDEYGRNGYRRQADARITTVLDNGLTVEQNAHKKQQQTLLDKGITRTVGASKQSKKILAPIIEFLNKNQIDFYFDKSEYIINDNNDIYFYDLTIPKFKMIIEYQSSSWHAYPLLSEKEWEKWSTPKGKRKLAKDVLIYDYNKAKIAFKLRGLYTYYVWEQTQNKDIEDILCWLEILITKS